MNANRANQQSISARTGAALIGSTVIASDTVRRTAGAGTSVRSCMTYTVHPRPARNQRLPVRRWRRLGVVGRSGCARDMDCRP